MAWDRVLCNFTKACYKSTNYWQFSFFPSNTSALDSSSSLLWSFDTMMSISFLITLASVFAVNAIQSCDIASRMSQAPNNQTGVQNQACSTTGSNVWDINYCFLQWYSLLSNLFSSFRFAANLTKTRDFAVSSSSNSTKPSLTRHPASSKHSNFVTTVMATSTKYVTETSTIDTTWTSIVTNVDQVTLTGMTTSTSIVNSTSVVLLMETGSTSVVTTTLTMLTTSTTTSIQWVTPTGT